MSNTSQSPSWWLIAKASFLRPTKTVASMLVQQVDESQSKKTVAAVNEEQAQAGFSPQPNDVFVDFGNCHPLEQEVQNFVNVEEVTQELRDAADVRMNLPEDHMSLTLDGLQPDDSIDNTTGVRALVRRGTLINSVSVKGALMANSAGRGPCASWGDMSSAKIARMKSCWHASGDVCIGCSSARAERHLDKFRFCRRCIDGKFRALMKLAGDNWGRFSLTCEKAVRNQ